MTAVRVVFALALLLGTAACMGTSSETSDEPAPRSTATGGHGHDHGSGAAMVSLPVGDGTTASEVGYSLRDVTLPATVGEPGRLSFVVENFRSRPHTKFLTEQTKDMHVYVVREDYAVFRHVHPELGDDGTWSGNLTLPEPGEYRVVAEFVARDDGGNGDHLILGEQVTVPGSPQQAAGMQRAAATDWGVEATVASEIAAGSEEELRVRVSTPDGEVPSLGQYLGTVAHLTGFHEESGGVVHMHPLGAPSISDQAAELVFHAELPEPGRYLLFLQVVADDFLHTVPLEVTAG